MAKNNRMTPKEYREQKAKNIGPDGQRKKIPWNKFNPVGNFNKKGAKRASSAIQKAVGRKDDTIDMDLSAKNTYGMSSKDLAEMRKKKLNKTTNKLGSNKKNNKQIEKRKKNNEKRQKLQHPTTGSDKNEKRQKLQHPTTGSDKNEGALSNKDAAYTGKGQRVVGKSGDVRRIEEKKRSHEGYGLQPGQTTEQTGRSGIDLITNKRTAARDGSPQTVLGGAPSQETINEMNKIIRNNNIAQRMEAGDYSDMGATEFTKAMQNDPSRLLQGGQSGQGSQGSSIQNRLQALREKRGDIDLGPSGGIHETMDRLAKYKSLNQEIGNLQQTQGALQEQQAKTQGDIRERRLMGEQQMDRGVTLQKLRNRAAMRRQKSQEQSMMERKKLEMQQQSWNDYIDRMQENQLDTKQINTVLGDIRNELSEDMTTTYVVEDNKVKKSSDPNQGMTFNNLPQDMKDQLLKQYTARRLSMIQGLQRPSGGGMDSGAGDPRGLGKFLKATEGQG